MSSDTNDRQEESTGGPLETGERGQASSPPPNGCSPFAKGKVKRGWVIACSIVVGLGAVVALLESSLGLFDRFSSIDVGAVGEPKQTLQMRLDYAVELYQKRNFDEAEKEFRELVKDYPEEARIVNGLAMSIRARGTLVDRPGDRQPALALYREALPLAQKAAALDRASWKFRLNLAGTYSLLKDFESVARICDEALALVDNDRDRATVFFEKGRIYDDAVLWEDARDAYRRATELDSRNVSAWANLATMISRLDGPEAALPARSTAIKLEPTFFYLWLERSKDHLRLAQVSGGVERAGHLRQAEYDARQARDLKRDHPDPLSQLGAVFLELGDLKNARESLEQAVAIPAHHGDASFQLGLIHRADKRYYAAAESFQSAISLYDKPHHAEGRTAAYFHLGEAQMYLGKDADAVQSLISCLNENPAWHVEIVRLPVFKPIWTNPSLRQALKAAESR